MIKQAAYVNLIGFRADSISVDLNRAEINGNVDTISFFKVSSKNSNVFLSGKNIHKLSLDVDKTELSLSLKNKIKSVSGNLKNHSRLNFSLDGNATLNVDSSSSINSFNSN